MAGRNKNEITLVLIVIINIVNENMALYIKCCSQHWFKIQMIVFIYAFHYFIIINSCYNL